MQNTVGSMVRLDQTTDSCNQQQSSNHVIEFRSQVENILAWLKAKEQEISAGSSELALQNEPFERIIEEYTKSEKLITEVGEYSHVIMHCKESFQDVTDNIEALSDEDRDEIVIGMDSVEVSYEKLKILATDNLKALQRLIDDRQHSKINRFEEWLNVIEMKIASLNNIGPDHSAIQRQLADMEDLNSELAQKQDFLNFMSSVIIFDDVDPESLRIQTRSSESLDRHLENLNRRWTEICRFVDGRNEKLRKADSIWMLLIREGPRLDSWLKAIEEDINETSDVANSIPPREKDRDQNALQTIQKILARSDKIDSKIKSKQSLYTSLERMVRHEIEQFDDPCSMLVIELEKQLESMQDDWNSMMRKKRILDYAIQALTNPKSIEQIGSSMIPLPDPITQTSNTELGQLDSNEYSSIKSNHMYADEEILNLSSSSDGTSDQESIVRLDNSYSDPRSFENSLSSESKSLLYDSNHDQMLSLSNSDRNSRNCALNVPIATSCPPANFDLCQNENIDFTPQETNIIFKRDCSSSFNDTLPAVPMNPSGPAHSCRVEEWEHLLESFSNWLKEAEITLNIENSLDAVVQTDNFSPSSDWIKKDPTQQLIAIDGYEKQINSGRQKEFEHLMLHGHQIIEDLLLPDTGETDFASKMEDILASIEFRFEAVKKCIDMRKLELTDTERWSKLVKNLRDGCSNIICQMEQMIPETDIGVDLITLAEQQDRLMSVKSHIIDNPIINGCRDAAKLFLDFCDHLKQLKNEASTEILSVDTAGQRLGQKFLQNTDGMWSSLKKIRKEVEDGLDELDLHESELLQLVDDRLLRLDQIHKEMHSLQYKMQELAAALQVAEILKSNWSSLDDLSIEELSEQLEELKLYREKLNEIESAQAMNAIYDQMRESQVPLSQQNIDRINELNSIWDVLQVSVEERQRDIELAFDNQSASEQRFLTQTVADLPSWERRVATSKVPYFIDQENNKTKWNHPKFEMMLQSMSPINDYVFAAYRTALKLRIVQKTLNIDLLMLEKLGEILQVTLPRDQNASAGASSSLEPSNVHVRGMNDPLLGVEQVIFVLKSVYEKIQTEEKRNIDVPLSIDLTLNWLLNLYDSTRTGYISALSLRVGLALICCATREDKYTFMFKAVANPNLDSVDNRRLETLFEACMRIPIYLGEGESFGGTEIVGQSVRDCYAMSKFDPQRPSCISLNDYLNWLKSEPSFISWLPVLHRVLVSENTIHHNIKCKLCLSKPIVGLRYRCFQCFKFNICQNCFLSGRHINGHMDPAKHVMQEYCCNTSSGENFRDFTKILRNKLQH